MLFNISVKKAIKMKNILLIIFAAIFLLSGCDYFENGDTIDSSTIEVNISRLPAIPDSMTYVAWVENEDTSQFKPTIIFAADAVDGNLYYRSEVPLRVIQAAQKFWLSIEPDSIVNDSVFIPGDLKLLGGNFLLGSANLEIGRRALTFDDFSVVFNLLTPTDDPQLNETSGIWFAKIDTADNVSRGLDLPELYGAWIYEGWVEVNGTYLSTGRFTDPSAADMSNHFSGSSDGLDYPGEDFLQNAPAGLTFPLDLKGKKAFISVELNDERDFGESPYIKIFETTIPADAGTKIQYQMTNTELSLPFGNVFYKSDVIK